MTRKRRSTRAVGAAIISIKETTIRMFPKRKRVVILYYTPQNSKESTDSFKLTLQNR